jgi:hypothetical protein
MKVKIESKVEIKMKTQDQIKTKAKTAIHMKVKITTNIKNNDIFERKRRWAIQTLHCSSDIIDVLGTNFLDSPARHSNNNQKGGCNREHSTLF